MRRSRSLRLAVATALAVLPVWGQNATPSSPDASQLVRRAVENQIKTVQDDNTHFMFRGTRTTPRGSVTKIYIQTKGATAGLVVAYDGKPLSSEQRAAEEARVERFIKNPEELEKKRRQEQQDAERTLRILRAMPDAFLYEYAGEQPSAPGVGKPGSPLTILKFRPNPHYDPPSRIEQVLQGMEGTVLVDAASNRLTSIEGKLIRDVGFGWGILGRLDKGGHLLLQQQEVGQDHWTYSRMNLDFTGKILLVKTLNYSVADEFSNFKTVPADMTFEQAIEMLKKQEPATDAVDAKVK
jgi:hypothetical protein